MTAKVLFPQPLKPDCSRGLDVTVEAVTYKESRVAKHTDFGAFVKRTRQELFLTELFKTPRRLRVLYVPERLARACDRDRKTTRTRASLAGLP